MKYQRLTPSGYKDIAIWKSEFVAKTQFLCLQTFRAQQGMFFKQNWSREPVVR